ncbi:MAG: Ca-activated chloride channel [Acidimicrobiaceae bacterium]|jgi:Ca-activated chloride channel family protein|nr:Ca-activated chloride channel [Acidimicrobiaceae bacterium]
MSFTWPLALLLLLVVPLLLGLYLWQLRRKRKHAVRFSSVALIRAALPRRSRWRRHVPVALLLASIAVLAVATARPQVSREVPLSRTSIILTLDVSGSMCSTDVAPNRLTVAQQAAKAFVKDQVAGTRIGIVAFAGFAQLIVPPTTDKAKLTAAINNLTTSRGTVIGAAMLESLNAIAAVNPDVQPASADATGGDPNAAPPTVPPAAGSYVPDIIVLLTDGANTRGIDPVDAAQQVAGQHVRVYTIGFGTENPTQMVCTREQLGAGAFDDGGFNGGNRPPRGGLRQALVMDESTLQQVADITGGKFYHAQDAAQLKSVFAGLPNQIGLQKKHDEISVVFAFLGALLAAAAVGLSLLWNRYP